MYSGSDYGSSDTSWMHDDGTGTGSPTTGTASATPTLSPATPYHGAGENPFGKDFDPFPDLVDRPGPAPNPTPDDWSGAAETSRYSTNDNEPDWMRGGGGGAAHHPPPRLERQPSPEFGASTYREPTVQFDGDDGHTNTSSKDALNQSLLLNRGAGQHDNPS